MSSLRFAHVCAHSHLQYAGKCVSLSDLGEGEERRERREESEKGGEREEGSSFMEHISWHLLIFLKTLQ